MDDTVYKRVEFLERAYEGQEPVYKIYKNVRIITKGNGEIHILNPKDKINMKLPSITYTVAGHPYIKILKDSNNNSKNKSKNGTRRKRGREGNNNSNNNSNSPNNNGRTRSKRRRSSEGNTPK
jgi:hypothetical protein